MAKKGDPPEEPEEPDKEPVPVGKHEHEAHDHKDIREHKHEPHDHKDLREHKHEDKKPEGEKPTPAEIDNPPPGIKPKKERSGAGWLW